MGKIVAGMATSHAFTFVEPDGWDEFRARNRESLLRRMGMAPPPNPRIEMETLAENERRYARVREAHEALRSQLADEKPDALIVIGDDQNENFTAMLPQIAIFVGAPGKSLRLGGHFAKGNREYAVHRELAQSLCIRGVEEGFDIAAITEFNPEELKSHAHVQILEAFASSEGIPVVLIFVNAIHVPAIEPGRCFALGQMIARAIAGRPALERVAICASGGLSHFTAGYPWKAYTGAYTYGDISEDFDRHAIRLMLAGEGEQLSKLSSADLMSHGDIEMRAWITLLGAMGAIPPRLMVYEPFYRAVTGMAVASWSGAI